MVDTGFLRSIVRFEHRYLSEGILPTLENA
jgi:hypothetical protein